MSYLNLPFSFLLYIFSRYGRVGAMCIGKLSLNLFKLPNSSFCERLYKFLEEILPKVRIMYLINLCKDYLLIFCFLFIITELYQFRLKMM